MRVGVQYASRRPIGCRCARQVRPVRFLPVPRYVVASRRLLGTMVHPRVPARRNGGSLCVILVDHPAPFRDRGRYGRARPVVFVALFVGSHKNALAPCEKSCAERLAVPPSEDLPPKPHTESLCQASRVPRNMGDGIAQVQQCCPGSGRLAQAFARPDGTRSQ